ncbi:MAG TPA: DEAD/DEAH box helicase, partial [Patescibacteria group bacterium]|nr:DEAD/DEAH box helicase [Patescibacteria group bacterium]
MKSRFDPYRLPYAPRPKQKQAFSHIDKGYNTAVILPTGYGKTNIALYAFQDAADHNRKFLMLLPLKALVDEMKEKLGRYFDILPVSGDYRQNKRIIFKTETDSYSMTYEMAYQLMISTRNRPRFFKDIEWIVIDEAHLMTDWGRGPQLESFLYLLQNFCKDARFILLTATVGNPKEFSIHFGCKLVYAMPEERPVKLIKEVKPHRHVSQSEEKIELIETLLHETIQNCPRNKKDCPSLLVFCNSRRLTKELHESLAKKQRYPWIRTDFHHAGRSKEVRNRVEEKFREGDINLLFATPTLAMGVNVPADIVIICGVTRVNPLTWKEEMLEASEIIQMIGRAGRGGALSKLRMQETDPNTGKKTGPQLPYGKAIVACEDSDEPKVR